MQLGISGFLVHYHLNFNSNFKSRGSRITTGMGFSSKRRLSRLFRTASLQQEDLRRIPGHLVGVHFPLGLPPDEGAFKKKTSSDDLSRTWRLRIASKSNGFVKIIKRVKAVFLTLFMVNGIN